MMSGQPEETPQERLSRYRNLAVEARQAAARAGAADVQASFTGLAKSWDDLADQLEREPGIAPGTAASSPSGAALGASFGTADQPACESCGQPSYLSRRAPHPARGPDYELQSFTCSACGHEQTRDANWRGPV